MELKGLTFNGFRLGFEENDLKVSEFNKLTKELKNIQLVPTKDRIEEMRMTKRDDEIQNIRAACRLTDQCFGYLLKIIKPGITEKEIAWDIESFFRTRGADIAFSPIVAFGKNSSQPHYSLTNNSKLTTNNLVLLDFGARVNGYCADMTRVVFLGKPNVECQKTYQTVLNAQNAVLTQIESCYHVTEQDSKRVKISGSSLDKLARNIIEKAGFPAYHHSLGHNLGLDIHEEPRLTIHKDTQLRPGMVFSVEPSIYLEGQFGIRIEDLILLRDDGIEILTKSPKNLLIL